MNSPASVPGVSTTQSSTDDGQFTPFHWLLVLGFPPALAAHILAPEVFKADDV